MYSDANVKYIYSHRDFMRELKASTKYMEAGLPQNKISMVTSYRQFCFQIQFPNFFL